MQYKINNFNDLVAISGHHLKDNNLSLSAKGLLTIILAYSCEWQRICGLLESENEEIKKALNELSKQGYIFISADKQICDIYEKPKRFEKIEQKQNIISENPMLAFDFPILENENVKTVLCDFIEMRKEIKKPMTDRAIRILLKKLQELSNGDSETAVKILEKSIFCKWQDIYALDKNNDKRGQKSSILDDYTAFSEIADIEF